MHTKLDIMHNDLHFRNVLATKILNPKICEYIINGGHISFLKNIKFEFLILINRQKYKNLLIHLLMKIVL
jgi:hypothetical protein